MKSASAALPAQIICCDLQNFLIYGEGYAIAGSELVWLSVVAGRFSFSLKYKTAKLLEV